MCWHGTYSTESCLRITQLYSSRPKIVEQAVADDRSIIEQYNPDSISDNAVCSHEAFQATENVVLGDFKLLIDTKT